MAKKRFFLPFVSLDGGINIDDPDPEIGPGSGDSTDDPFACSYEDWLSMFEGDYDGDGDTDFDDYRRWWTDHGFTEAEWGQYNTEPLKP